jgi:diguanylate cyclase (GGDEF)-like protein
MKRWLNNGLMGRWRCALRDWLPFRRLIASDPSNTPAIFRFDDELVAKRVMRERVRVFADRAFFGALTAPLGTLLLAWIGGLVAGWLHAALWFFAFALVESQILLWGYRYRAVQPPDSDVAAQERRLVGLNGLVGLIWGTSVWVFCVLGQMDSYLFNLTILVGVAGISIMIMAPSRYATVLFFAGLLLPPLVQVMVMPNPLSGPIAVGIVIFFGLLLQYGWVAGRQLERDLESTVRNEILAERLRLALGSAQQDWFDLNLKSETMAASSDHIKELDFDVGTQQTSLQQWLNIIHPQDLVRVRQELAVAIRQDGAAEAEYRIRSGASDWLWVHSAGRVVERNAAGKPLRMIGVHMDVSARKEMDEKIQKLAFYDHLTELPNRRMLQDRLQHAIASVSRKPNRRGALMLLDMDDFKALNDTWGHDVGDRFLVEVSQRLLQCVREVDTVARLGGDEFVVILGDLEGDAFGHTRKVAEEILHVVSQPYQLDLPIGVGAAQAYSYHCTSSVGVVLFGDPSNSVDELMKQADTAMYQAKAMGRNTFRFFDPEMQAEVAARAVVDNELHHAIRKNEFTLYYQAQVDGAGRVTGAEALIRWQHPTRGLVSPAEFIAQAEVNGIIQPMGRWVLESACAQLVAWAAQPETARLTLSVNISAVQFRSPDFVEHILRTITATGANPKRLKLEVTESLLLNNVDDVIGKMVALKSRGLGFSLDDFGTGYSSLAYLKLLPLDQIKIDRSFVRDVLTDTNDLAIIRIVVALANTMGVAVMAEGVETDAQRALLAVNGCHAYQGYFFARPVPIHDFVSTTPMPVGTGFTAPV